MDDEGYLLRISKNKIEIKAHTPKGNYYAAMSLIQMLEKANGKLPCVEIIDWPDMKMRGISDDISRGQVSNLDELQENNFSHCQIQDEYLHALFGRHA